MDIRRNKNMSKKTHKEPIGLVLSTQKDKDDAREVSIKYGIKILYEDIFSKENHNHLYLFDENGIALGGTYIISRVSRVLYGAKEYEDYLHLKREEAFQKRNTIYKKLGLKTAWDQKSGCSVALSNNPNHINKK